MSTESSRLRNDAPNALPVGTRLGEFELRSLLGVGGFGIVYLAFDHALEREVAVKEYMPASLAGRTETMHVSLRSQSDAETFALGLKSFVNEAKLLARFDHPSLLKVHRFWEANGTAYMAMPVLRGRTLKDTRQAMRTPPDEAWLRALLDPLLGAIERLHSEEVYHRDIAPDNIQIEPGGHPVLLDFGAARRVISDMTHTITAILKPAYAPIEQYAEANSVKQGPWTDLYALGATLHFVLLGRPPAPATTRAVVDEASALTTANCPGCSEDFLRTIDWMLAPRPADRPQNVAAVREALAGRAPPQRHAAAQVPAAQWDRTVSQPTRVVPPTAHDDDATVVMPPAVSRTTQPPPRLLPREPVAATPAALPPKAGMPKWIPIGAGLGVVVVAAAAFALWPKSAPAPAAPAAAASAPAVLASAPAPAPVVPLAASAAQPESAVANVVLPGTPAVKPAAGDKPVTQATRTERQSTAQRTTPTPAPQPVETAPPPPVTNSAPVTEAPRAHVDTPTPAPVTTAPAPVEPAKPVVTGPEAKCAGRSAVSRFGCMERECLRGQFQSHPDCLKWRQGAKPPQEGG